VNSLRAKIFKKEEFDDESLFTFFHLKHAVTLTLWRSRLFFSRRVSQFIEDHVCMKWSIIDVLPNNNSFPVIIYWFSEIARGPGTFWTPYILTSTLKLVLSIMFSLSNFQLLSLNCPLNWDFRIIDDCNFDCNSLASSTREATIFFAGQIGICPILIIILCFSGHFQVEIVDISRWSRSVQPCSAYRRFESRQHRSGNQAWSIFMLQIPRNRLFTDSSRFWTS
jgi:hypothetical protein